MDWKELLTNNKFRWLLLTLLVVAPFEVLSLFSIHLPLWVEFPLFLAITIFFGKGVFQSGFRSLLKLDFSNINLLLTIAVFGAVYLQQFEEAVIIVVLFALGETLEEYGIERSQTALKNLTEKFPKTARIKNREEEVPIENVRVGDVIIIKPGDQMPLDGKILFGNTLADESTITGEPLPVSKHPGNSVYAGTVNTTGYIEVEVTKKTQDTALSKIIELTYKSAEQKSRSQRFIESFAKFYTPGIVLTSIFLVVVPVLFLGKAFTPWFTQALTLLIISCPCALVISTPVAIFSAIGNATRKGTIIKGGRFLEEMGKVKAIAFDKTRTLTKGEPAVSDIIPFNNFTEQEVVACAAGMETFSEHPIARSIVAKAEDQKVELHPFEDFRSFPGKGLKGQCTVCYDKHHCLGNLKFVTEEHEVKEDVIRKVEEFEAQGKTIIVSCSDRQVKGVIGVTDEIREESKPMVDSLLKMGIVPVILTGDNRASAGFVASQLGIQNFKAELLPDRKVEEIRKLLNQYKHVAMVGDGVNDAPALATSSVGVAMGAIGSDVAIENADIALMSNDLNLIPYLIDLGRKCVQKIRFNIAAAIAVKFLFLGLAIGGFSNLALAIFADVGVTVIVILNSLRLYSYRI
jgi:Cd2+/Zn2+-exporting ATPase